MLPANLSGKIIVTGILISFAITAIGVVSTDWDTYHLCLRPECLQTALNLTGPWTKLVGAVLAITSVSVAAANLYTSEKTAALSNKIAHFRVMDQILRDQLRQNEYITEVSVTIPILYEHLYPGLIGLRYRNSNSGEVWSDALDSFMNFSLDREKRFETAGGGQNAEHDRKTLEDYLREFGIFVDEDMPDDTLDNWEREFHGMLSNIRRLQGASPWPWSYEHPPQYLT